MPWGVPEPGSQNVLLQPFDGSADWFGLQGNPLVLGGVVGLEVRSMKIAFFLSHAQAPPCLRTELPGSPCSAKRFWG